MKRPMAPPDPDRITRAIFDEGADKLSRILGNPAGGPAAPYLPWDKIRHKVPPEGLTHEEWWAGIKFTRRQMQRALPLPDVDGRPFTFALPDAVLEALEHISRDASGQISIGEQVTNPGTRDRYLVNSLIEEAINSSQLEGASTTRRVAKEMIRVGRIPRDRDERMIFNNYQAMRRIGEIRSERLTVDLVKEIHGMVTEGTLDSPNASARFQLSGEERIGVFTDSGVLLHRPPPAEVLEARVERLCAFANGDLDEGYIPPVIRAITLHFMIGYEHPFEDGNGRTARALFYWSMLNQGYWLMEYVAISPILKQAPTRYARSYVYSEDDESDLTYFHLHQLDVLRRAIAALQEYLSVKAGEVRELERTISGISAFNHRQIALLQHALRNPDSAVTAQSHMASHNVSYETARQDLTRLEENGLFRKRREGKAYRWAPAVDIETRLHDAGGGRTR